MRILVIGGSGTFIGAHVVGELTEMGHEVAVLSRREPPPSGVVRYIAGDRQRLRELIQPLRAFKPDIVVDAILSSGKQARDLIDVFGGVAARIVALSSMDVYRACGVLHGSEPGPLEPLPLTESSPVRTRLQTYPPAQIAMLQKIFGWLDDDYDKIPVERTLLASTELTATILRLPMVYGPGDKLHRFFPVVKRIDDSRPAIILSKPFVEWRGTKGFIDNVAAAVALAATSERAAGRIYNVGEPDTLSELEWARLIADTAGWRGEFVVLPPDRVPAHLRQPARFEQHWSAQTTRIREDLGYRERVSREDAVRRTIEWERANPPAQIDPRQFDYAAEDAVLAAASEES